MLVDEGPAIHETVFVTPSELDSILLPPTDEPEFKVPQAGMTFFENDHDGHFLSTQAVLPHFISPDASGPDENVTRAGELDRAITALILDMQQSMSANQDFLNLGRDVVALQADWQAWRIDHMSYFQMTATENDLDRFTNRYNALRARFSQVVGKAPSAPPLNNPPPSGPFGLPPTSEIMKVAAIVGGLAALFIFGPTIAQHLK